MLASWRVTLCEPSPCFLSSRYRSGLSCRARAATALQSRAKGDQNRDDSSNNNKKIVIVGSGWAGLGAAHHLSKQGFDVTLLDDGNGFGSPDDVSMQGFWYPYQNIFSLVDELGIKPFTNWMKSSQYSEEGLEVQFPIFQDLPQLPTPFGTLYHTQFFRLPLVDRLTSLPLMAAVINFDNTDVAWKRYDPITARELFKQFGCSERLYRDVIGPLLQVGLFAPGEQLSAAATLGILYYFILAHQKNFDLRWCKGTLKEKIFEPWMDSMKTRGCEFLNGRRVTDFLFDEETGCISDVVCGEEKYNADAVILAVGISTLHELVKNRVKTSDHMKCLRSMIIENISLSRRDIKLDFSLYPAHAILF